MSPLLNYTTSVPVARTAGEVMGMLSEAGAKAIMHRYEEGQLVGLAFTMETPYGEQAFEVPVNVDKVQAVLRRQKVAPRYCTLEHSARVAWRILKDWMEAQLAVIRTEMVTLDQVMLPYMRAEGGGTVYELIISQQKELARGD